MARIAILMRLRKVSYTTGYGNAKFRTLLSAKRCIQIWRLCKRHQFVYYVRGFCKAFCDREQPAHCWFFFAKTFAIMGKCRFKPSWETEYKWVQKTNDIRKAHCRVCLKTIDVGGMGESALKSHQKGETHKENHEMYWHHSLWVIST